MPRSVTKSTSDPKAKAKRTAAQATRSSVEWSNKWPPGSVGDELRQLLYAAVQFRPEMARRAGLTESEFNALEHLAEGPLGPVEIGKRLGVTSAASSGIVDRLVQRGHVYREVDETDGRRTRVVMTEGGRQDLFAHLVPFLQDIATIDDDLSADERIVVQAFLRKVTGALRKSD